MLLGYLKCEALNIKKEKETNKIIQSLCTVDELTVVKKSICMCVSANVHTLTYIHTYIHTTRDHREYKEKERV